MWVSLRSLRRASQSNTIPIPPSIDAFECLSLSVFVCALTIVTVAIYTHRIRQ